jgi:hypothetical protein
MKIKTKTTASCSLRTFNGDKVLWGFMLENTSFTEFQEKNHVIIETAYRQRKQKNTSSYIDIIDHNLPKPNQARVYFGVVQMHLRMPGTRYYVKRKVINTAPVLLSPCSATSLTSTAGSSSSPFPITPSLMPSPISTVSTATTAISSTSIFCSDILYPQLDSSLAALFSEDMMLPVSYNNTDMHSSSVYKQFFTPIGSENMNSNNFTTTFGNSFANIANSNQHLNYVENGSEAFTHISSNAGNYNNDVDIKKTALLGHNTQYVDNTQYRQQHTDVSLNFMTDFNFAAVFPTDGIDLFQDMNWLIDESLYTQPSISNNSISFQNSVSWPNIVPPFVPKLKSGDDGNINMTNVCYDKNQFIFL